MKIANLLSIIGRPPSLRSYGAARLQTSDFKIQTFAPQRRAFTLVEMLVVIAVIATLAAMIFPAFGMIKRRATIQKAQTELKLVASAITDYKHQYGHYPPDHPGDPILNGLYFELLGTVRKGVNFETANGSAKIPAASVSATLGQGGFVNCTKGGGDDNAQAAKKFLIELKPAQSVQGTYNADKVVPITLLTCSVPWPSRLPALISNFTPNDSGVNPNPWRYVSSGPTNNPNEFDLWVDIIVGNQTNRISNWSDKPLIVP